MRLPEAGSISSPDASISSGQAWTKIVHRRVLAKVQTTKALRQRPEPCLPKVSALAMWVDRHGQHSFRRPTIAAFEKAEKISTTRRRRGVAAHCVVFDMFVSHGEGWHREPRKSASD